MSAPSAEAVAGAVIGALTPVLAPWKALKLDEAKGFEDPHVQVTVSRRGGGDGVTRAGRTGRSGWRITTRPVANDVDSGRRLQHDCTTALEGRELVVDGVLGTPIEFEGGEDIGEDDHKYSGLDTWTTAF